MLNHLARTTSPYLLQHAGNPVDWYPWGPAALEKARREDKPIFLSIGYAACHWCHVMAHESFEDPQTAVILNQHFVSIKVDREERPDLDSIYMSAVIALTGQGGWPMSLFLTPDLQPFYAGTYFPPERHHGLPSFKELLLGIARNWTEQRAELSRIGRDVAAHVVEQRGEQQPTRHFDLDLLAKASRALVDGYDWEHGGWGQAPRFPQPMAVEFLLRRHLAGNGETLAPARHMLEAMSRGGMYDVIGGGFARYSTDDEWHIPHFEKMLYDNAQLARAYLHAWQVTGELSFRHVAEQTLDFAARELLDQEGGFYSSLDADSDGGEGRYYTWTRRELLTVLGSDSGFFEAAYGVPAESEWEGRIVLQRALDDAALASRYSLTGEQVSQKLAACRASLLAARYTRPRPATDDKVLTAWNGLMLSAFAEAGQVLNDDRYLQIAARNADFLLTKACEQGCLRRTWRLGLAGKEVFLEDYAALILGLLDLYQADFDLRWFSEACRLAGEMIDRFSDPQGGFFDTPDGAETLLVRPRDLQDNASPSGNALAVEALFRLAALTGNEDWNHIAEKSLSLVADYAARYPTAFGRWLCAADFGLGEIRQVAILGDPSADCTRALLDEVRKTWRPDLVIGLSDWPPPDGSPALLADRPLLNGEPTAYVCQGFVCKLPVTEPQALAGQL